jgi:hypothetical protein
MPEGKWPYEWAGLFPAFARTVTNRIRKKRGSFDLEWMLIFLKNMECITL